MTGTPRKPRRTAFILSGGGARGAYEVGVLWYIFDEIVRQRRGRAPRVDIISGTSVGAINGCYLAAHLGDPVLGMRRLVDMWTELEMSKVLGFGLRQVAALPRLLLGGAGEGTGLFDLTPMVDMVGREISWRALSRSIRRNKLHALTVSTTEMSTGRTVVFMQTGPGATLPTTAPPRSLFRADHIGPHHALASAAIPLLFPPVRIDDQLYLDGGLRQNTPIAPALRLGATHVLAISCSHEVRGIQPPASDADKLHVPGAAFLMGKVLNAFLLDHIDVDLELLSRLNAVLEDGTAAFGPEFAEKINAQAARRSGPAYQSVSCLAVRPSDNIGKMAADHMKRGKFRGSQLLVRRLLEMLDLGAGSEADLASYLLFDGNFTRQLIELGRADAQARRHELLRFFEGDDHDPLAEVDPEETGLWDGQGLPQFPKVAT